MHTYINTEWKEGDSHICAKPKPAPKPPPETDSLISLRRGSKYSTSIGPTEHLSVPKTPLLECLNPYEVSETTWNVHRRAAHWRVPKTYVPDGQQ